MINIVLVEPEIPQNTGNIARTCAATGARLHLVGPLGFQTDDASLKRAGLDYWRLLDVAAYSSYGEFERKNAGGAFFFLSTKAKRTHSEVSFPKDCYLVFGKETKGLPEALLAENYDRCLRIPMIEGARSLNLSNAVAVVCYEALRQHGFPGLRAEGRLHFPPP